MLNQEGACAEVLAAGTRPEAPRLGGPVHGRTASPARVAALPCIPLPHSSRSPQRAPVPRHRLSLLSGVSSVAVRGEGCLHTVAGDREEKVAVTMET